jgi:DNA-binding phage protein
MDRPRMKSSLPRVLERNDVVRLLRRTVAQAGGQAAWAKETGTNRAVVNKILNGQMQPSKKIIRALKLRMVFVPENPADTA